MALASSPPSAISARTTAEQQRQQRANSSGASPECARPLPGLASSGQPNATTPTGRGERERDRGARLEAYGVHPTASERGADLADRQPPLRREDLGDLRGVGGRGDDDVGGRAVGDDLAVGEDDDPGRRPRRRARRRASRARPRARAAASVLQQDVRAGLGRIVEPAGGLVEQEDRRRRGEDDREREREPLSLGQVPRVGVAVDAWGEQRRAAPGWCRACDVGVLVGRGALLVDGLGPEQVAGVLRDEADALQQLAARRGCAGPRRRSVRRPRPASTPRRGPAGASTSRRRCVPSRRRPRPG